VSEVQHSTEPTPFPMPTCVHEAGHVVMAWAQGLPSRSPEGGGFAVTVTLGRLYRAATLGLTASHILTPT